MAEKLRDIVVIFVGPAQMGKRLDVVVTERCGVTRSQVGRWIAEARVRVNDKPQPSAYRLRAGERVAVAGAAVPAPPGEGDPRLRRLAERVVYRDSHHAVLDKPAGVLVHPVREDDIGREVTVADLVEHWCGSAAGGSNPLRRGIVHRLDRDTTGLMLVALEEGAWRHLGAQLRTRLVRRAYWAVCHGVPTWSLQRLWGTHTRDHRHRSRFCVTPLTAGSWRDSDGLLRDAAGVRRRLVAGEYRRLGMSADGRRSLIEVNLATGRTHQIRAQLAAAGHPLVGDVLYGGEASLASRPLLHSRLLQWIHPVDGRLMSRAAEPPPDMLAFLARHDFSTVGYEAASVSPPAVR